MADIRPFRAIRYNPSKIADMRQVVTPPYDVIDARLQDKLYARHPHNFVRLDLAKVEPHNDDKLARYRSSSATLKRWLEEGVLQRDERPALYVYHQRFAADGQEVLRKGFICTVRVHDYKERVVLPHERTLKGPKIDRLELMKATNTQMSQIFLLYNDPQQAIDGALDSSCAGAPDIDITTEDGIQHQLWVVSDEAVTGEVQQLLANEKLLIADGHHRYETALAFRDLEAGDGSDRPRDFTMAYLANAADPGLLVWPTHRSVHSLEHFDFSAWLEKIRPYFHAEDLGNISRDELLPKLEAHKDTPSFIVLRKDGAGQRTILLRLNLSAAEGELNKLDCVESARLLDVTVLHDFVLAQLTGVSLEAQAAKTNIRYPRFMDEVFEELEQDETELVFLMNATPIEKIRRVCVDGGFMPQKSTYFYPKVLSGLVVNDLSSF